MKIISTILSSLDISTSLALTGLNNNLPLFGFFNQRVQQAAPNFLQSYQEYQRGLYDSRAATVLLFLVVAFFLGLAGIFLINYISRTKTSSKIKKFKTQSDNFLKNRAVQRLYEFRASIEQINVFFSMMNNNDNYAAVMESPDIFERYLNDFKIQESDPKKLRIAESLRDTFNFNFNNLDIEFSHTRMLPVRQKLRVFLHQSLNKTVDYASGVVRNQQDFFAILPPKLRGVWVKIDRLKEVELRVFREGDSEYQFFCPIMWQSDDIIPQVVLQHTENITKISTRLYQRYSLELQCQIAKFSDNALKSSDYITVTTRDISQGGMCLAIPKDIMITREDILEINLVGSSLSTIFGRVIAYNRLDDSAYAYLNIEFTGISEVERLLIGRYIKRLLKNMNTKVG